MLAEFAAALDRLAAFESAPFVAVGVSGGPDSLALAILADRWARARGGEICALTVDHRLRPESGAEIRRLAGWLSARAIRHKVLVWDEEKPATGIQEAARAARYRLLAGWCREHGCLHLLTAHHRDDQAETHLIRREAGSGADGLAGMSAVRELDCCRILRPLLGVPKARLAAMLDLEGQPFIADPSNRDPAFARGRLRVGAEAASAGDLEAAARRRGPARRRAGGPATGAQRVAGAGGQPAPGRLRGARLRAAAGGARRYCRAGSQRRRHHAGRRPLSAAAPAGRPAASRSRRRHARRRYARRLPVCRLARAHGWCCASSRRLPARSGSRREASLLWDRRFRIALPATAAGPLNLDYLGADGVAELGRRARRQPPAGAAAIAARDFAGVAG